MTNFSALILAAALVVAAVIVSYGLTNQKHNVITIVRTDDLNLDANLVISISDRPLRQTFKVDVGGYIVQ